MTELCPCESKLKYAECCEPFHNGRKDPPQAKDLMRARYCAFALGKLDYVFETHHPKTLSEINQNETRDWAIKSQWKGLEIIQTKEGASSDKKGLVEFKAYYNFDGQDHVHAEIAEFEKDSQGKWKFVNGYNPKKQSFVREEPKVGRNDVCPCGSGKKFKKCCAKESSV